jgi:hypothetical protein
MVFTYNTQNKHVWLVIKVISKTTKETFVATLFSVTEEARVKNLPKFTSIYSNWFQMGITYRYLGVETTFEKTG